MADNQDYVFRNAAVAQKLVKMWNNVKYSDTTFLVNKTQFHASSHLVTVSSNALEYLIDNHYENCHDREITVRSIKQDESFANILRYIYGIDINFTQMSKAVMCEVLDLSESYELADFSKELKCFLSKLDCFQLDSAVALLNAAKKFHLNDLYEKLTVFAYKNTEQMVKHESFAHLQYDVLRDLLKSDWFCAAEIDILTGVLIWHSDMNRSPSHAKKLVDMENDIERDAEETDVSGDGHSDFSDCETDENVEENTIMEARDASSGNIVNRNNTETCTSYQAGKTCAELVQTFSQNVLKVLLSHIRVKEISYFHFSTASRSELFKKYTEILTNEKSFSLSNECRKKYGTSATDNVEAQPNNVSAGMAPSPVAISVASVATQVTPVIPASTPYPGVHNSVALSDNVCPQSSDQHIVRSDAAAALPSVSRVSAAIAAPVVVDNVNHCIKHTFMVSNNKISCSTYWTESEEEHIIGKKKWKISIRVPNDETVETLMQCRSDECNWKTTAECQIKMIGNTPSVYYYHTLVSPDDNSFKSITLSSQQPCVQFGAFDVRKRNYAVHANHCYSFEVHFHTKVNY